MRPYRLLAEALAEVEEGVDFYLTEADFDPTPAIRFEAALSAAISEIRESPTRWPFADDERDARRFPLARPFQDWALIYLLEDETVLVLAVAHGSRRPGYWRSRRAEG